ncbi:uncharacterized protein LY89DRAFT_316567 [Mollisia scopiformis]|uniref:Zn(2)-C6 fungal-type domain-containing protein n=1 Tax=Mollisia scopiformis TaxID=149040 RepID=A0A132BBE2_MOLSC|nr:uncharacterized protein LY89DRAFT_316567 [Mollisia scopiformis]KUJ08967.1 hypothetical protein LY89DRAFT_316567 [Mollisia scopiformis]
MADPEVGKILTQFHGPNARSPSSSGSYPASQFRASNTESTQPSPLNHLSTPTTVSTSEPSPNQPSASPAQPSPAVKRSRQRPTKSCERCRAKKLKCDRELPCSNCKKGGRDGKDCEYRFGSNEEEGTPKAKRPRTVVEKNGVQIATNGSFHYPTSQGNGGPAPSVVAEQTFPRPGWSTHGESIVGTPAWGSRQDPVPIPNQNASSTTTPLGRIDVKGLRSRYIGIGDKMAVLDHFEHSKCFIVKSFQDPEISPMMQELSTFQRHYTPRHKCKPDIMLPYGSEELMAEMLKALPSAFLFGTLQAKYVSNWETVFRILHIPTFMRECDELQAARQAEALTVLPDHIPVWVVPQILAVLAIGSRLKDPSERSVSGEELPDEAITKNCLMVQRWLDELHGKITLNFPILQTRALLLLARHSNLSHTSELCRRSGDLVRFAMTMGLHKDPEECTEMSKAQKEMRRKLWFTIVELDMRFSLAAGMPASITTSTFNVRHLINVDDQELQDDMPNYPVSKGDDVWTNAMAQIALLASLRDRLNATNLLGGCLDLERDAPALLSQAKTLEQALRSLPDQFRGSTRAGNSNNKRMYRLFTSIMLDMAIRRPLVALYRTISTSPQSSRYPEARRGALRCSLAILSHLDALDPAVADLSTVKSRDYLNLFHLLCRADIMHSAIIVCYEIRSFNSSPDSSTEINEAGPTSDDSFPQTKHSLTRVVENTLNSILQRLGEFGSDLKDILPLAVVLQSVRSDGSQEEIRESMIKGTERVLKACRTVMPSIEHAALLNSVARGNDSAQQAAATLLPASFRNNSGFDTSMAQPGQPYGGYGGNQTWGDFNVIPSDLNFADFDLGFGFTDWDMNQYYL